MCSRERPSLFGVLPLLLRSWLFSAFVCGALSILPPLSVEGGRLRQKEGTLWASGTGCNSNHFVRDELVVLEVYGMLTNFHFLETECVVGPLAMMERARFCCLSDTDLCYAPIIHYTNVIDACTETHRLGDR